MDEENKRSSCASGEYLDCISLGGSVKVAFLLDRSVVDLLASFSSYIGGGAADEHNNEEEEDDFTESLGKRTEPSGRDALKELLVQQGQDEE